MLTILANYPNGQAVSKFVRKEGGLPHDYTMHVPPTYPELPNIDPPEEDQIGMVKGIALINPTYISTTDIHFQEGPVKEVGVNGITEDMLMDILIDRYQGFQAGQYACQNNADILRHLTMARHYSEDRTKNREIQGVEGRNQIHDDEFDH